MEKNIVKHYLEKVGFYLLHVMKPEVRPVAQMAMERCKGIVIQFDEPDTVYHITLYMGDKARASVVFEIAADEIDCDELEATLFNGMEDFIGGNRLGSQRYRVVDYTVENARPEDRFVLANENIPHLGIYDDCIEIGLNDGGEVVFDKVTIR